MRPLLCIAQVRWIPTFVGVVAVAFVVASGIPELHERPANAQAVANLAVAGVAPNNSSARVFYQPVPGARDYRVYDSAAPTVVKYAGLAHLTPSAGCPGLFCLNHFVAQADGVTPVFPYQVANGATGGPQVLDGPATEIEWNSLGDGQPHTLVVEAVDQLGPVSQANLYTGAQTLPIVGALQPGAMLGSNKGPTLDGNISTNGQGPFSNRPQVIARSQPFVVQARPDLKAIPARPSATQQFFDTFENGENGTITQTARDDVGRDKAGNFGSKTYSLNAGTPKEWTIEFRQADNTNSMPFIASDHFMDMLFDGATPKTTSAPSHTLYSSMSMTPRQTLEISSGKALHLTMEVDGHQSFRRWLAFDLAPASDPIQAWDPGALPVNNADQAIFMEVKDGGCTLDIFTGPKSASDRTPTGSAGGRANGARLWGQEANVGGAPISCGSGEMYNRVHFSKNGLGLDDRDRFDFFLTQDHAALFEDGQLIVQSDIPAGSFPWANVPLKAYYSHYLYHSEADVNDLKTFKDNGAGLCYPLNAYWFNDPALGTTSGSNVCGASYPSGYGFPFSDERHWDNMGFEVWPAADVPANRDFSQLASFVGGVNPTPTPATPTPANGGTRTPTNTPAPPSTPASVSGHTQTRGSATAKPAPSADSGAAPPPGGASSLASSPPVPGGPGGGSPATGGGGGTTRASGGGGGGATPSGAPAPVANPGQAEANSVEPAAGPPADLNMVQLPLAPAAPAVSAPHLWQVAVYGWGGVLTSDRLSVSVPSNVVGPGGADLNVLVMDSGAVPGPADGFALGDMAFAITLNELGAANQVSHSSVPLALEYQLSDAEISAAGGNLDRLKVAAWNNDAWVALPCTASGSAVDCAVPHLSLFALVVAPPPADTLDGPLSNGWFYKQANGFDGAGDAGFSIVDDADAAFWTEFQRLGGVQRLGYPISKRFEYGGLLTQAFQKGALQWQPELNQVVPVNILDDLSARGADIWLDNVRQVPPSGPDAGQVALLDGYPELSDFYAQDPGILTLYGLPLSIKQYGSLVSVRLERGTLQYWTADTPWAPAGTIVTGNAGDLAKDAGLWPVDAVTPER